jgi:peptide/nickel transport system substrate-binding protein
MKKRFLLVLFCMVVIFTLVLVSCTQSSTSSSPTTQPSTQSSTTTSITPTTTTNSQPVVTSVSTTTSTTGSIPLTTVKSNWWDSLGKPEYGGAFNIQAPALGGNFDPYNLSNLVDIPYEQAFFFGWTIDPKEWNPAIGACPAEDWQGWLVQNFEWKDPQTLIMHLHQGIKWHNKAPVNGREMTADDMVYSYTRMMGSGKDAKPNPMVIGQTSLWQEASALDKYTLQMKFKNPTLVLNWWSILDPWASKVVAHESVEMTGGFEWKNVVGTSPFLLTEYTPNSSMTWIKNPDYWGVDERFPQNKLPYIDKVVTFAIPDSSTALAALRTKKVDFITSNINAQTVQSLQKTNPEISILKRGPFKASTLEFRCDQIPFKDIRVRKAMNMAIDRKTIASSYYGGAVDGSPAGLIIPTYGTGYTLPYTQWSQDLKDQYSYNPTKAKQLLAEAGFSSGFRTNLVFSSNPSTSVASAHDAGLLQILKSMFMDIGVDVELKPMEDTSYQPFVASGKFNQMCIGQYANTFTPNVLMATRYSKSGTNYTHNNDPTYDAIYEKLNVAKNLDEAKSLIMQGDMYALSQHWAAVVCLTVTWVAYQPSIKGYMGQGVQATSNYFWWARFWLDQ